jgi:D-beta-D-heptose 7-phosphate kinase/D-beta-D-heptose 1-phosphate adenosyltransferase
MDSGKGFITGATSGCFDILHPGHIRFLRQAWSQCDKLVVLLNTDESVRGYKRKPFHSYELRKEMLKALHFVDEVRPLESTTPVEILSSGEFDIFFKGIEYKGKGIPEESVIEVEYLDVDYPYHGSDLLKVYDND